MTQTDGLNILLAWVFFGILLALLAWLLLRSGQDDALSSVTRPDPDDPRPPGRSATYGGAHPGPRQDGAAALEAAPAEAAAAEVTGQERRETR